MIRRGPAPGSPRPGRRAWRAGGPGRRPSRHRAGRRRVRGSLRPGLAAALAVVVATAWWLRSPGDPSAATPAPGVQRPQALAAAPTAPPSKAPIAAASAASSARPLSALGEAQRREQLALWQGRLVRARATLEAYQIAARYPHESRPIEEHPDQVRPFAPIAEDRALRMPGGAPTQGVHLRTTQERVFAAGLESSRITLTLQDDNGRPLPLRVLRAVQKEVTPPERPPTTREFAIPINDSGTQGDAQAGDGVFTAVMQPGTQGFAGFAGTVRLELHLEYAGQPGFIYFDLVYSPEQAATWLPGVREVLANGSLELFVKAQVALPGRYVVSGRIDDAEGKPLALATFNGEVPAGVAEFKLPVFGLLIREKRPTFPLVLRDVEAFLLKPDTFPDRVMLPRLAGTVHTTRSHPLAAFSDATWSSEERDRYLAELGRDLAQAEDKVREFGP